MLHTIFSTKRSHSRFPPPKKTQVLRFLIFVRFLKSVAYCISVAFAWSSLAQQDIQNCLSVNVCCVGEWRAAASLFFCGRVLDGAFFLCLFFFIVVAADRVFFSAIFDRCPKNSYSLVKNTKVSKYKDRFRSILIYKLSLCFRTECKKKKVLSLF